jgi:type II secretory pathway component PulJ
MDIDASARTRECGGVQLAELLVALALTGTVMGATYAALDQGQRAYAIGAARVETQQNARIALARLAAEIRGAGAGGTEARFPAIIVAEPQRIVFQRDLNGDGVAADAGETVTWRLAGTVLRRDAGGGAQPIINGVRDLRFVYRDGAGAETIARREIRSVEIALVTIPDHARSESTVELDTAVHTGVRLRNR